MSPAGNNSVSVEAANRHCPQAQSTGRAVLPEPPTQAIKVKHAVRRSSQEGPALPRRAPTATSATVIHLSAISGGGAIERKGETSRASERTNSRRGSGGPNLLFGGILALILLIVCLAWEVLVDGKGVPHAAAQSDAQPAAAVTLR
jgi:hypothetical protein